MMEAKSLSNFSDDILCHILSFLDFRDIARLRAVSKRFQILSIFIPSYSFSFSNPRHPYIIDENCSCEHVFNFMNTLHQQRPRDLNIHQLSFSSSCMKHSHHKLHKRWLNKLFQDFRVDELSFDCKIRSIFKSLPRLQYLRVLKLIIGSQVSVKPPEMKLPFLERLHMENFETQNSVGTWISQSFPSLKSLVLVRVSRLKKQPNLTIQSSCLEDLTIEYCFSFNPVRIITPNLRVLSYINYSIQPHCNSLLIEGDAVVEVSARNLQSLTWQGHVRKLCDDTRAFLNLQVVTLTNMWFKHFNLVDRLFEAMHCTRTLRIDSYTLLKLHANSLISFGNVRHLEILNYIAADHILTTCFEIMPNLETLTIATRTNSELAPNLESCFKDAYWMCKKTRWKKIKGLKTVNFQIRHIDTSTAFLMGMLKKSCVHLKEMTLIYPSHYDESIKFFMRHVWGGFPALSINFNTPNVKRCRSQYNSLDSLKKSSQLCYQDGDNLSGSAEEGIHKKVRVH